MLIGSLVGREEKIFHISFQIVSFTIASAHRLESGLVRLARRGTSALSKRRVESLLDDDNEKFEII